MLFERRESTSSSTFFMLVLLLSSPSSFGSGGSRTSGTAYATGRNVIIATGGHVVAQPVG